VVAVKLAVKAVKTAAVPLAQQAASMVDEGGWAGPAASEGGCHICCHNLGSPSLKHTRRTQHPSHRRRNRRQNSRHMCSHSMWAGKAGGLEARAAGAERAVKVEGWVATTGAMASMEAARNRGRRSGE